MGAGYTGQLNRKSNFLLPVLAAVCVLALGVMAYVLLHGSSGGQADFTPPPFETAAVKGRPDDAGTETDGVSYADRAAELELLGYSQLDAQSWKVVICGAPAVEDGAAVLYLTNPEENQVWLKVRVMNQDGQILGESGIVKPGEYVRAVALEEEISGQETELPVQLRLMAYEPETYHSAGAVSLGTVLNTGGLGL